MTRRRLLLALGVLLVLIGLTLGALIPVSNDGVGPNEGCGTPWFGSAESNGNETVDWSNDFWCAEDARQPRGTLALIILAVGAVVVGAAFVRRRQPNSSSVG